MMLLMIYQWLLVSLMHMKRECNDSLEATIFRKTDDLQTSVQSMKTWLLAGLTTIIVSLMAIIVRGIV